MTDEQYPPTRGFARFAAAAAVATLGGLLARRSLRNAIRFGVAVGAAVAAGDYAFWRFVGQVEVLDAGVEDAVEEIEVEIEDESAGGE